MEDVSLRLEFHRAIDAVTPPAPWLADRVRRELRAVQVAQPRRRRRWADRLSLSPNARRILAGALVVILVLVATGTALAIWRYTHGPIPVRPHLGATVRECGAGSVYMVDTNVGWQGTQRTTDGGRSWRDVSPPPSAGIVGKQIASSCALDGQRAWVAAGSGSVAYQPDQIVVTSTTDGGQSWQQLAVIPLSFATSWRNNFAVELDFLDDHRGWLLMEYASAPMVRELYSTSDGGVHWVRISTPPGLGLGTMTVGCAENGIMFNSPQRGWLAWDCARGYGDLQPTSGPVIASTSDGGRTWAPLNLQAYPETGTCTATTPIFSNDDGMLEVSCLGRQGQQAAWAAVYSTSDGGRIWNSHLLRVWAAVDIVDGKTAFFFEHANNANTLWHTTDGGVSWSAAATGIFTDSTVSSLLFIDPLSGFANVSNSPVPWWTHDGGKTWVTADGRRQVGNLVCTLPSDRRPSSTVQVKMVSPTTGWAAGALRTSDGGATWVNTKPPQAKYSTSGYGEFFLDSDHAWAVETAGSAKACSDHLVVFSTVNGGSTWQQEAQVPIQLQGLAESDGSWWLQLFFVDMEHGWLHIAPAYGLAPVGPQSPLYRTSDGGRHWSLVATQATQSDQGCVGRGGFTFSSPTTGWMSANCGTNAPDAGLDVLVTHDGGMTWSLQSLASNYCNLQYFPSGCPAQLPTFLDSSNGWLLDKSTPLLLMTTDGGITWARHGLPSLPTFPCTGKYGEPEKCSDQSVVAASFIDPNQGWVIIGKFGLQAGLYAVRFEHTTDGGKSWSSVSSNLVGPSASPDLSQANLAFVDQSNGFLMTGQQLLKTTDGGHTWSLIATP